MGRKEKKKLLRQRKIVSQEIFKTDETKTGEAKPDKGDVSLESESVVTTRNKTPSKNNENAENKTTPRQTHSFWNKAVEKSTGPKKSKRKSGGNNSPWDGKLQDKVSKGKQDDSNTNNDEGPSKRMKKDDINNAMNADVDGSDITKRGTRGSPEKGPRGSPGKRTRGSPREKPKGSMLSPEYDPNDTINMLELTDLESSSLTQEEPEPLVLTYDRILELSENCFALYLNLGEEFCFTGKVQAGVVQGSVNVMGHYLLPDGQKHPVYSPECTNYITIATRNSGQNENKSDDSQIKGIKSIKKLLKQFDFDQDDIKQISSKAKKYHTVLLLWRLEDDVAKYLCSVSQYAELFHKHSRTEGDGREEFVDADCDKALQRLGVFVESPDGPRVIVTAEITDVCRTVMDLVNNQTGPVPVVAVCGGKNVGKSSLCRLLINTMLNQLQSVCYLECDIGQTEFTPPGVVSLTLVQQPVIGPPFTHQREPVRQCFVGALSPADDPEFYISCLRHVYEAYVTTAPSIPLIVNTMGWNQGLGIALLAGTFDLVKPTYVVQLDHPSQNRNYPPLTSQYLQIAPRLPTPVTKDNGDLHPGHDLMIIASPVVSKRERKSGFGAPDLRGFALMGQFSAAVLRSRGSLLGVQPYEVPWSAVAVHVVGEEVPPSQILLALNGQVVALAHMEPAKFVNIGDDAPRLLTKPPVCQCLGFGIIRGIDPEKKVFYIISAQPQEVLDHVNVLMKGGITVHQPYLVQRKVPGKPFPYMDDYKQGLGAQAPRRSYNKRRRHDR